MALPRTKLIYSLDLYKKPEEGTAEMPKKLINTSPCKVWQGTYWCRVYVDHGSNKESNGLSLRDYFKQPTRGCWPISFVYSKHIYENLKASASV